MTNVLFMKSLIRYRKPCRFSRGEFRVFANFVRKLEFLQKTRSSHKSLVFSVIHLITKEIFQFSNGALPCHEQPMERHVHVLHAAHSAGIH